MKLALGILFIFFGSALVYTGVHGIGSSASGFYALWQGVLHGIDGQTSAGG